MVFSVNTKVTNLPLAWMRAVANVRKRQTLAPGRARLNPTSQHVLLVLGLHLDSSGRAFPSHAQLAAETGLSARAIGEHLRLAEADGWLGAGGRAWY